MQSYSLPWEYRPQLTKERLSVIAEELLRGKEDVHEILSSPLDDNYTRATCTFGQQKNLL